MRRHLCRRRSFALSPVHLTLGGPDGQLPAVDHGWPRRCSADDFPRRAEPGFLQVVLWRYEHQPFLCAQREPQTDRRINRVPERCCEV